MQELGYPCGYTEKGPCLLLQSGFTITDWVVWIHINTMGAKFTITQWVHTVTVWFNSNRLSTQYQAEFRLTDSISIKCMLHSNMIEWVHKQWLDYTHKHCIVTS